MPLEEDEDKDILRSAVDDKRGSAGRFPLAFADKVGTDFADRVRRWVDEEGPRLSGVRGAWVRTALLDSPCVFCVNGDGRGVAR